MITICFFEEAAEILGTVDGFVNSAALGCDVLNRGYEPWDITPDEWDMLCNVNLKSAFYLMSDYGEIICGHTVVADGGDKFSNV